MLFVRIDHAAIVGARVDVQAHGALTEFRGIVNFVNRVGGIDGARAQRVHLNQVRGYNVAGASLQILLQHPVILNQQLADRHSHPAILVFVIVDGANLANVPADGHQFEERGLVNEIAGVVLAVPDEIFFNGFRLDGMLAEKLMDRSDVDKVLVATTSEFANQVLHIDSGHESNGLHRN
jgi:hypothetical protein